MLVCISIISERWLIDNLHELFFNRYYSRFVTYSIEFLVMVQDIEFYTAIDQQHNHTWKTSMNTHMSLNTTVPQHSYGPPGNYTYSPNIYNHPSSQFPYNNGSMQQQSLTHVTAVATGSPQDYNQGFSIPPYHIAAASEQSQYVTSNHHTVIPSESSTADSNGSIVSEFDANRNPIKKRRKPAPTIATGRRNLKDESVNTEEADRRDKRRERNRKSAQRCRERKIEKKDALEQQISDTNITCKRYIELAENVLKAWKQRLHLLNEKLPCHNYKSQLSVSDFENLIEMMHSRNKETSDTGESCNSMLDTSAITSVKHDYTNLPPQINNTFITCPKLEPYYQAYNNEVNVPINHGFEQYHNCTQESSISYI